MFFVCAVDQSTRTLGNVAPPIGIGSSFTVHDNRPLFLQAKQSRSDFICAEPRFAEQHFPSRRAAVSKLGSDANINIMRRAHPRGQQSASSRAAKSLPVAIRIEHEATRERVSFRS